MRHETQNKLSIKEAKKIIKGFDNSIYWLKALVDIKQINKVEAGIICFQDKEVK